MTSFPEANSKDCIELLEKSIPFLDSLCEEMKIDCVHPDYFKDIVIPLSVYLLNLPEREEPYFIGINGGQGSGKTTLSDFIQTVLSLVAKKSVTGFSIDDIYKTVAEREKQSNEIHPLCKVRGVPGTHDIQMGLEVLDSLYGAGKETLTPIPSFSKLLDSHKPKEDWKAFRGRPEYIFF